MTNEIDAYQLSKQLLDRHLNANKHDICLQHDLTLESICCSFVCSSLIDSSLLVWSSRCTWSLTLTNHLSLLSCSTKRWFRVEHIVQEHLELVCEVSCLCEMLLSHLLIKDRCLMRCKVMQSFICSRFYE